MITTIALTVLMPVTGINPIAPAHLPGPSMPVEISRGIQLPGPKILPIARIQLDMPRPGQTQKAPSAIDTLKKLVKDDRPIIVKAAFDNVTLPESDLLNEIGVPVYAGR